MTVATDGETYEKLIIFGGINDFSGTRKDTGGLGNQLFMVELRQIM